MCELRQEVEQLQQQGYVPFAADECSLAFETSLRKAWIKRGEKTVIQMNRSKTRKHYFGALNLESGRHELIGLDWQDTPNIIAALRTLSGRYPNQKLCLIWDNAKWHRSKELKALLGEGQEFAHVRFVWLPPYAPDENPQEHVWKVGKDAVANRCMQTFAELKSLFESAIEGQSFQYKIRQI